MQTAYRAAVCALVFAICCHNNGDCATDPGGMTAGEGVGGRIRAIAAGQDAVFPQYMRLKIGNGKNLTSTSWLVLSRFSGDPVVTTACHYQPWSSLTLPSGVSDVPHQTTGGWEAVVMGTFQIDEGAAEDAVIRPSQEPGMSSTRTGIDVPEDDCLTLVTGSCPITWGDPLNPTARCNAHCIAKSSVEDGDTHIDKCLKTMDVAVQGPVVKAWLFEWVDLFLWWLMVLSVFVGAPGLTLYFVVMDMLGYARPVVETERGRRAGHNRQGPTGTVIHSQDSPPSAQPQAQRSGETLTQAAKQAKVARGSQPSGTLHLHLQATSGSSTKDNQGSSAQADGVQQHEAAAAQEVISQTGSLQRAQQDTRVTVMSHRAGAEQQSQAADMQISHQAAAVALTHLVKKDAACQTSFTQEQQGVNHPIDAGCQTSIAEGEGTARPSLVRAKSVKGPKRALARVKRRLVRRLCCCSRTID